MRSAISAPRRTSTATDAIGAPQPFLRLRETGLVAGMDEAERPVGPDGLADARPARSGRRRGRSHPAARIRPPPSATTAKPTPRLSIAATMAGRFRKHRLHQGCRRQMPLSGRSIRSAGPPSAATMRAKRSAAVPLAKACSIRARPSFQRCRPARPAAASRPPAPPSPRGNAARGACR